MSYEKFAYLYDSLMKDVPYEKWVSLIERKKEKYKVKGNRFLDLACGTGELSIRLANAGYEVTGVDLSSDMLAVAQSKSGQNEKRIFFIEQNMCELQLTETYDFVGIFCDSLNYLETNTDVIQTFKIVSNHIKNGGLFLFDVHSLFKINDIFVDQSFTFKEEEVCYIWDCYLGEYENSVEHELTFFQLDQASGHYHRYDELHKQRTFPIEKYVEWLDFAGFEVLEVIADFFDMDPVEQSERIFFIARKK
ncbi:class I SAM-dependent methyltransferase [Bacillus sp. 03113]|uniref:class I SAM-dependent DNA methyltransferase n=1 Tax=Bacillus sp. 03113 TaxID=2578211 RepID=UPI001142E643|nr:class I SAM-dependent methyltransferase [Bacillus sp. 03113]